MYTYLWYIVLFLYPIIVAIIFNFGVFENHPTPLRIQIIYFVNSYMIAVIFRLFLSVVKK